MNFFVLDEIFSLLVHWYILTVGERTDDSRVFSTRNISPEYLTSFIWLVSPLIGFILTPFLGSLSDTCTLSLGRRRPFIILLSVFIACGTLLLSQSANLLSYIDSKLVSANEEKINLNGHYYSTSFRPIVIVLTVMGVAILDFGCDSCQSPCRFIVVDI